MRQSLLFREQFPYIIREKTAPKVRLSVTSVLAWELASFFMPNLTPQIL